jgi:cellulose synthase/poly-beta-1,6-N-acetylglucosamine synthase-like glycosyltransferase
MFETFLLSVNLNNNDSNSNTVRKINHSKAKIKSWENEKVTDFQENIDEEKLHTFEQKLSRWQHVNLPIFLSLPTLPLTIYILFPLQKCNNRLPNLFLDLSILILLSGIFKSFSMFVKIKILVDLHVEMLALLTIV